jgi:hypothetical protein
VVYVDCRQDYQHRMISNTEPDGGICFDGAPCVCSLSRALSPVTRFVERATWQSTKRHRLLTKRV